VSVAGRAGVASDDGQVLGPAFGSLDCFASAGECWPSPGTCALRQRLLDRPHPYPDGPDPQPDKLEDHLDDVASGAQHALDLVASGALEGTPRRGDPLSEESQRLRHSVGLGTTAPLVGGDDEDHLARLLPCSGEIHG